MSTQETRQRFQLAKNARNWGLSALIAACIGGYTLYQRSAVAADSVGVQVTPEVTATAEATAQHTGRYIDGEYTGSPIQTNRWGTTQVVAVISGGELTDFKIVNYPHSTGRSLRISQVALPDLMQEAVQVQSASVDMISGATQTSEAFIESLESALQQAANPVTSTPTLTPTMSQTSV